MAAIRKVLWIGALVFGLAFVGLGIFFIIQAQATKTMLINTMAQENVTTSADAEKFGVPAGLPVTDAKTAQAQADVIAMHSTSIKGNVLKSGQDTVLRYADMKADLFVSTEAYNNARNTYLNGLNLRNSLSMAVMGFGVVDLVTGTGAAIILIGVAILAIAVPALYWAQEAEKEVVAEVSHRLETVRVPAHN